MTQTLVASGFSRTLLLVGFFLAASSSAEPASQAPGAALLPPARPNLLAVPLPDLDALESSVAQQIREVQQAVGNLVVKPNLSRTDLADAYGSLGQLYHDTQRTDAARSSFAAARKVIYGIRRSLQTPELKQGFERSPQIRAVVEQCQID